MQKIMLLTIGKLKEQWAREAAYLYIERLKKAVDLSVVELGASHQPHASGQLVEESERLLVSARKQPGQIWVLDERGKHMTSQEFADALGQLRDRGEPVTFILGGAYGLSDAARSSAHKVVALSAMTLPHELCRVFFLEQLYRATEIAKGSGYHH